MAIPNSVGSAQDPKSNEDRSSITDSNKSSQTPSGATQNLPQGTPKRNSVISGAGSSMPRRMNGHLGR